MVRGPHLRELALSAEERARLVAWTRRGTVSQALALRARIVLACADGRGNREVAALLGVTPQTVGKWRARFVQRGVEGLVDEPRPGAPRKRDDALLARIVALQAARPEHPTAWSSRAIAVALGVSQSTVARVLRSPALQAARIAGDPLFVEKVRDIVGVYFDPPLNVIALCVSGRRACARDQGARVAPAEPDAGALAPEIDTALFGAIGRAACSAAGEPRRAAGSRNLLGFLRAVEGAVPKGRTVHVVIDEQGRRSRPSVEHWFARKPRLRLHVMPDCGSWMGQLQRWYAVLAHRAGRPEDGTASAAARLKQALCRYLMQARSERVPFAWVNGENPGPRSRA